MRLAGDMLAQRVDQPRLADAGLSRQHHRLTVTLLCLSPAPEHQAEFLVAPGERRQPVRADGVEPRLGAAFTGHPPGVDGRIEALEHSAAEILEGEQGANQGAGRRRGNDGVRGRDLLQAGREVGRLAGHRRLLGRALAEEVADHHGPGGDADTDGEVRIERTHRLDNSERRAGGTFRVVLVRAWITEIDENPITHVLGDISVIALDRRGTSRLVAAENLAQILRI